MTAYEVLKLCGGWIDTLEKMGVRLSDHKYTSLFENYIKAQRQGEKICYIVAYLAEEYNISERSVYDIMKRLKKDCKTVSP